MVAGSDCNTFEYSNFTGAGDVWFSLNGTTYQNNSCVALEDIGGGNSSTLCCVNNQTACCSPPYTGEKWPGKGNCFFPHGTCVADGDAGEDMDET